MSGTKNKLGDLNNLLFEQAERLLDDDISEEQLKSEIMRSKALTCVSEQIIKAGQLSLEVAEFKAGLIGKRNAHEADEVLDDRLFEK